MKQRHESLRRGQGLVSLYWSALIARGRTYLSVILISSACTATALPAFVLDRHERQRLLTYGQAEVKLLFTEGQKSKPTMTVDFLGRPLKMRADRVQRHPLYRSAYIKAKDWAVAGSLLGILLGAGLCVVLFRIFEDQGEVAGQDDLLRGALLTTPMGLQRLLKRQLTNGSFNFAGISLPSDFANRHIAIAAASGAGKTTALRELLDQAEAKGEPAVVFDTSSEFTAQYYRPERGDVILNPFDARGCFWDVMDEAKSHPADADHIAQKLIPDGNEHDESVWVESAQNLVANIIRKLIAEDRATLADLIQALRSTSSDDLARWLADTSSARIFAQGAERATASVLFSLTKAIETLQFLKHEDSNATPFTFSGYFDQLDQIKGPKPWIFIPRREKYFEAMKPLLACWLELASVGIMSLEPNEHRRIWMFLDELPDIPKVVNLQRLLPQGRKFGACTVITFQAIGQMRLRYTSDGAEALLGNAGTKLILQCGDADTRKWASQMVGEVEAELRSDSENLDFEHGKGRTTVGKQRQIRPAVLESEFKLEKHAGYLLLADGFPVTKVRLSNKHIIARGPARQPGFIPGDVADTLYGRKSTPPESNIDFSAGPV
jgi:hypothetical protein